MCRKNVSTLQFLKIKYSSDVLFKNWQEKYYDIIISRRFFHFRGKLNKIIMFDMVKANFVGSSEQTTL